jgi:hypothetical protein
VISSQNIYSPGDYSFAGVKKNAEENCKELVVGTIPITYMGHLGLISSRQRNPASITHRGWKNRYIVSVNMATNNNNSSSNGNNNSSGNSSGSNGSLYYLCPMHWFKNNNMALPTASNDAGAAPTAPTPAPPTGTCPISGKKVEAGVVVVPPPVTECPVKHTKQPTEQLSNSASCPVQHAPPSSPSSSSQPQQSACPVKYKNKQAYNVYSQPIDPTNQMPVTANQLPAPGQEEAIDTTRVSSTIPKGGTNETWTYPSPQMVSTLLNNTVCS